MYMIDKGCERCYVKLRDTRVSLLFFSRSGDHSYSRGHYCGGGGGIAVVSVRHSKPEALHQDVVTAALSHRFLKNYYDPYIGVYCLLSVKFYVNDTVSG